MMSRNVAGTLNRKPTARATWLVFAAVLTLAAAACDSTPPGGGPSPGTSSATQAPGTSPATEAPGSPTPDGGASAGAESPGATQGPGKPGHVFVINLENKGYDEGLGRRVRGPVPVADAARQGRAALPVLRDRAQLEPQLPGPDLGAGVESR